MLYFTTYIAANIGQAFQNGYLALIMLRCIQSAGSSRIVAWPDRGNYIAYTSVALHAGPSLGPIIGGLLVQYVCWHILF